MTQGEIAQIMARLDAMDRSRERSRLEQRDDLNELKEEVRAYHATTSERVRLLEAYRDQAIGEQRGAADARAEARVSRKELAAWFSAAVAAIGLIVAAVGVWIASQPPAHP